jgi:hypothetical protein
MKALRFGRLLTAVLAAIVIFAGNARAQMVVKDAHFTLPFEASLDGRVLPAGDYTLSVGKLDTGRELVYRVDLAGAGTKHAVAAVASLGPRVGAQSVLVAETRGKTHAIRELQLHGAGLVLRFREAKAEREQSADRHEQPQNVPILVAEK